MMTKKTEAIPARLTIMITSTYKHIYCHHYHHITIMIIKTFLIILAVESLSLRLRPLKEIEAKAYILGTVKSLVDPLTPLHPLPLCL